MIFPQGKRKLKGYQKNGKRRKAIQSHWGKSQVWVQRYEHETTRQQVSVLEDASLDESGYTPWVLERLLDLALRLPFEEATIVANGFGIAVSVSELERLSQNYNQVLENQVKTHLEAQNQKALCKKERPPRAFAVELDGVRVLGQPQEGVCEGIEIKTALVYPINSPSQRTRVACITPAKEFAALFGGLLRQAGIRQQDSILALGDGAVWIADLLELHNIPQVLDVFHAAEYFQKVLVALGWSQAEQDAERAALLGGEIDMAVWFSSFMKATDCSTWSDDDKTALAYLQNRTHLMHYPALKARGYPIGSGQIEGMNKHVIGKRMKCSGMHWSRHGASRMAAARAELFSNAPIIDFKALRFKAFPVVRHPKPYTRHS